MFFKIIYSFDIMFNFIKELEVKFLIGIRKIL